MTFLPDFCSNRSVSVVVVIAGFVVIMLSLAVVPGFAEFWVRLGLIGLFIHWVTLWSVAILCWLRPLINRLASWLAILVVYLLVQLVTLLSSLLTYRFVNLSDFGISGSLGDQTYFLVRNLIISSLVCFIALRYFYVRYQWEENVKTEAETRLRALQARIRPHFLFNSLNTIVSLVRSRPEKAEDAILDLADLFRSTLAQKDKVSLQEELDITRRYLSLEALRLGERLRIVWAMDEHLPMDAQVPALILQPLVENAVYHGIQPRQQGGTLRVQVRVTKNHLLFEIANPLPEIVTPEIAGPEVTDQRQGNHLAQDNIRQRLQLAYGELGRISFRRREDEYQVAFIIPLIS